jgi:hypothetical protein
MKLNRDPAAAFAAYEGRLRDFVKDAQGIPKIVPRLANPQSKLGLFLMHGVVKAASVPGVRELFSKLMSGKADGIELPDYE